MEKIELWTIEHPQECLYCIITVVVSFFPFLLLLFIIYVYLCVHVPSKFRRGCQISRIGVTSGYETPHIDAEIYLNLGPLENGGWP